MVADGKIPCNDVRFPTCEELDIPEFIESILNHIRVCKFEGYFPNPWSSRAQKKKLPKETRSTWMPLSSRSAWLPGAGFYRWGATTKNITLQASDGLRALSCETREAQATQDRRVRKPSSLCLTPQSLSPNPNTPGTYYTGP